MEKLQDFDKGKLMGASKMYRSQCDCFTAADAMDVTVDACGRDDEDKDITLTFDFKDRSFWRRLAYAWQIVRGHWTWREFCLRQDDCGPLSEILDPGKTYSELP